MTLPRIVPPILFTVAATFLVAATITISRAQVPNQPRWEQGEPSGEEQFLLQYLNRARADPAAEGRRLAAWLREVGALRFNLSDGDGRGPEAMAAELARYPAVAPLAYNPHLGAAARVQAAYQASVGQVTHRGPGGSMPFQRAADAGYGLFNPAEMNFDGQYATESVGGGLVDTLADHPLGVMYGLLVDWGNPGCPHRVGMLDAVGGTLALTESGPGWVDNYAAIEFGDATETAVSGGAKLTGAVSVDLDGDGFYSPGEGLAGVTVTSDASSYHALTSASGGYSLPVDLLHQAPAVATVTFAFPDGRGESRQVAVPAAQAHDGPFGRVYPALALDNAEVNVQLPADGRLAVTVGVATLRDAPRAPGAGKGKVVFTRAGGNLEAVLTLAYAVGGSAVGGLDYKALSGTVTFDAGVASVTLKVKARPGGDGRVRTVEIRPLGGDMVGVDPAAAVATMQVLP